MKTFVGNKLVNLVSLKKFLSLKVGNKIELTLNLLAWVQLLDLANSDFFYINKLALKAM